MENSHQQAGIMRYWMEWNWNSPLGFIVGIISIQWIAAAFQRGLQWLFDFILKWRRFGFMRGFLKTRTIPFPGIPCLL